MAGPNAEVLIAGEFTVNWNGVALGMMEGDAGLPTIEATAHAEAINSSSTYGKSQIDSIYLGADFFAAFTCLSAASAAMSAWWPFGTFMQMGVIARSLAALSQALVLTAVAGTPAAGNPNTLTATKAILTPESASRLVYGPTLRKVPIRMILFPTNIGGGVIAWGATA